MRNYRNNDDFFFCGFKFVSFLVLKFSSRSILRLGFLSFPLKTTNLSIYCVA